MPISHDYEPIEPSRSSIDATRGSAILEFGAPWCGYCIQAKPLIAAALRHSPDVRHIKIEDGRGRPLGRSFRVKLWPTLIFLQDGHEIARLVRPNNSAVIEEALHQIAG